MRIRDLKWKTVPVWSPEWWLADEGAGEEGVLEEVQLRNGLDINMITVSVTHQHGNKKGVIIDR